MKRIATIAFCAAAFMLIAAPIYMNKEAQHQVFFEGKPFASAVLINGKLAFLVDDVTKALGGAANVRVQGNKLTVVAPRLQASSSANTIGGVSGVSNPSSVGSATGGAGAGKIRFNEFQIKKTTDSASPIFFDSSGKQFIWFEDVAKFFGVTQNVNGGTLAPGAPINLHVAPNRGAAIAVGNVNGD